MTTGLTEVRDFNVNKGEKKASHQSFELEFEGGEKVYILISNELAYELAHQIQKNVERSVGIPDDSEAARNGRFYSRFYGMQP